MSWANQYVGLPFAWNGYSRDGIGCWGLVCLVQKEQFGRDLPRFDDMADLMAAGEVPERPGLPRWIAVARGQERPGDILQMLGTLRGRTHNMHCGVIVEPGRVLHSHESAGSVIVDYRIQKHARLYIEALTYA